MGDGGHGHGQSTPLAVTAFVVVAWYAANILVVISNKWLLSNSGFSRPVFLTLCHMIACVIMGLIASVKMPLKPIVSSYQTAKLIVLAVLFCGTILLGNASLQYLPVSFNQAVGATTPFFTAVLAFILQGARESYLTYAALLPVVMGVVINSGGEPAFHALGFLLCISATAGRALKSVVQSMLMTDPAEKLDPMSLLLYMSGICVVLLLPTVWILEPTAWSEAVTNYVANPNFLWYMTVNAILAYLTNLLNFLVTKCTSALTLQVLGNAKGVVAAVVSVMVFRNAVTVQGALGYAITVGGVFLYSWAKKRFKPAAQETSSKAVIKDVVVKARGLASPRPSTLTSHASGNGAVAVEELQPFLHHQATTPTASGITHPTFRN